MLCALGLLVTLLRGNWLNWAGSSFLDVDLLTVLIAYVFVSYGRDAASVFAFGEGLLFDLFSGGLHGLFTALYLIAFGSVYAGCLSFNLQDPKGQFIIVLSAMLFKGAGFLLLLAVFSTEGVSLGRYLWPLGVSAFMTALLAPLAFGLLNRLRAAVAKGESNGAVDGA